MVSSLRITRLKNCTLLLLTRRLSRTSCRTSVLLACLLGLLGLFVPVRVDAQAYSQTLPWNYSVGNPSSFSAYVNGQLSLTGDVTGTAAVAQSAAGGSILGINKEIVSASATASAYLTTDTSLNVTVKVFGSTKYSFNDSSPSSLYKADSFKSSFDQQAAQGDFQVGPFDVHVTVGVKGYARVDYGVGLSHGAATASVTPAVEGDLYATAALDFEFVDVGVGVNLTLINDSLPIAASARLAPNYFTPTPSWGVKWDFNITNKMTLLNGNLYVFATLNWWFGSDTWKTTIFSWPGFSINNTLYTDSGWTPIGVYLPQLTSLSPPSVQTGSGNLQLTINGSGFDTASPPTALWDGTAIPLQSSSASRLIVTIPSSNFTSAGEHVVTVASPGPLGGTSNPLAFHVLLGSPMLTQISPGAVTAGGPDFTLTANGASLISGSTILWNSTPLTTTYVSDSQLTAIVPAQNISSVSTAQISVVYPGSGPTSNVLTLPVFDPNQPTVAQTFPSRAFPGSSDLTMHVVGTGFEPTSIVYWNGSPLATRYISGVQLDAQVPASLMVDQTVAQIDVLNSSGAPSNALAFTVTPVTYTAEEIPLPPGQAGNWAATQVNSSGLVAVNSLDGGFGYLWSELGGIVNLPIPFSSCVPLQSNITGLNNTGEVAGYVIMANCQPPGFLYSNGTLTYPFPQAFLPTGINDGGAVVSFGSLYPWWATVWQAGALQQLSGPGGTPYGASCCSINNAGQVIGNFDQFNGDHNEIGYTAVFWSGGSPTVLPSQYGDPILGQQASSLNDFGVVVGYGSSGWEWENGSISPLPIFPIWGGGRLINNNGDVLGAASANEPVIYSHGQAYNLNDLLSNPTIGQISSALSIADNGLIVGTFVSSDGTAKPVLLKPDPVPSNLKTTSASALTSQVDEDGVGRYRTAKADRVEKNRRFWNGTRMITTIVAGVQPCNVLVGTTDLQITVSGTDFVNGAIAYWNGLPLNTTFSSGTSLVASVPESLVATAGYATITAINPGGDPSNGFAINIENPAPAITALSPNQAIAGNAGFTMAITGNNFLPTSQVYWNNAPLSAAFLKSNQMNAVVPSSALVSPSIAAITIVNLAPGGGASAPAFFGTNPPAPVAINMSPNTAFTGSGSFTLTVSGTGFDGTSVVLWNDTPVQTTFLSPSTLTVHIPASYLTTAGTAVVAVTDTVPGTWPSGHLIFTINNPMPQLIAVAPASVQAGSGTSSLRLSGSNFVVGSQAYLDGDRLATTYVSDSQLTTTLSNNDVVAAKTAQLTVVNPEPCDSPQSSPVVFTITAPPVIQTINPAMARAGSSSVSIQVTGNGFTSQSAVTWSGTVLATSFVSATQLNAIGPSQLMVAPGTFPIRVTQQTPGGGTSSALAFTVYQKSLPKPAITSITPSAVAAGSDQFALAISGSGIVSTTTTLWNGAPLPSAFVSSSRILAHVPAANLVSPGKVAIQLQNPPDDAGSGGGSSDSVVFTIFDSKNANTTDYTSATAFAAAASNINTIGFNGILLSGLGYELFNPLNLYGIAISTPIPNASVNVTASGYYAPIVYPSDFISNSANPSADNTVVITLSTPTHVIGLNYGGLFGSGTTTITLSNGHFFTQPATPPAGQAQFVGFISVDSITSLTLTTSGNSWVVLNLLIGSPASPSTTLSSSLNPSIAGQSVTLTTTVTPVSGTITPTGSVVFLDGGAQIGTATLDSTAKATIQTSGLSIAKHSMTAQYLGDDNYNGGSISNPLVQIVNPAPAPDFTVMPDLSGVTVASPGSSSPPVTMTITAENGYRGTVNFAPASCSISPVGSLSSCGFSPSSITGSGSTQVIVHTTAPSTASLGSFYRPNAFNLSMGGYIGLLALILLRPVRRSRWSNAMSVVAFAFLAICLGCGSGSSGGGGTGSSGTPTGVLYTVTVTATATGGQPSHTASFTFTVQ